jgi:CRP/FNR family cyclic AMP-dependent transcriptional regulator
MTTPIRPRTSLLADLPEDHAQEILALGERVALQAGETLFRLGEPADHLFLLTQGQAALSLPMHLHGKESDVVVEEKRSGETLGWSALVPPHRFTLNATASIPSEVLRFPRTVLLDHLATHPDIGYRVALNVAAVIGHRLQVLQAMWLREMQRVVELRRF